MIEFSDKGLSYRLIRSEVQGERVKIIYSGIEARKERKKWMYSLHTQDIRINRPLLEQIENEGDARIYSREIMHLFEEIMHRSNVYVSDIIRFRTEHLLREKPGALKIEGNDKNIFRFLSILLLDIPDERICNSDRDSLIVFVLETAFLQYFYVGSEKTQEMRITYDELLNILSI